MNVINDRPKEVWKDIKETNNMYQISNLGRIRSLDRTIKYKNGKIIFKKGKIMKPHNDKDGYKIIFINPLNKHFKIHRLVAQYFLENKENLPIVNHKDKNVANNNVDNLEWCTYSYNNTYEGARDSQKKKILQYDLQGNFIKEWESVSSASKNVNTSAGNITECCKGKHKYAYGYKWKYAKSN
jgi:hypothetical protein